MVTKLSRGCILAAATAPTEKSAGRASNGMCNTCWQEFTYRMVSSRKSQSNTRYPVTKLKFLKTCSKFQNDLNF